MRWLLRSATKRAPELSVASPCGLEKLAPAPEPSPKVPKPLPARVLTEQPAVEGVAKGVGDTEEVEEKVAVRLAEEEAPGLRVPVGVAVGEKLGQLTVRMMWLEESAT